jgi:hypothetical protein
MVLVSKGAKRSYTLANKVLSVDGSKEDTKNERTKKAALTACRYHMYTYKPLMDSE